MKLEKILPSLKKNVSLKKYTNFKIGGKAKYFFEAKKEEDLMEAISAAKKINLPFFILGGGSNLLVSDKGYEGLVIKMQNSKIKMQNEKSKCKIICEAGVSFGSLVSLAVKKSLTGLEWAVGIPGSVGGAIVGNAGAFGKSIGDLIEKVKVLEIQNSKLKIHEFKKKDCKFDYRESIFKHNRNLIILSATLKLKKREKKEIKKKMAKYLEYRKKTQPLNFPSAGCIFKNPKKISAAKLIEKCNLKGKIIGGAKISQKHANFILNFKNAKAKDVIKLIKLVKQKVKKKFRIDLEEEVCYLGF